MKITFKKLTVACVGILFASTVNAAPSDYGYEINVKKGGYHFTQCKIDADGSVNLCTVSMVKKVDQIAKEKSNFGKNSVMMRFWDSNINYWVYGAVNKTTKKVFLYPRGLRAAEGNSKDVKLTFGNKRDRICTAGNDVDMVGDEYSKAYSDTDKDVDYCTPYNDATGFGTTLEVDAITRKVLQSVWT